jgi:cytochrome b6-f complex iron-sulfur subunit
MATTPVTRARSATAAKATVPEAVDAQTKGVSRREFLYYIWGASLALLLAETTGTIIWFALPRFRAGEYGGVFSLDPASLPAKGTGTGTDYTQLSAPVGFPSGKFWISNQANGLYALSMICTHLGCLFKWVDTTHRFECPCHGSKFSAAGVKLTADETKDPTGPAQRNLDRFAITVTTASGSVKTDSAGHAVKIDGATGIAVDTGKKIQGVALGAPGQKEQ